jgi:hypothetical protein
VEKAAKTLSVLGRSEFNRITVRKLGVSPPGIHYVEPRRLPADFCEVRKKQYTKLSPSKGKTGFPVPKGQVGTLHVAKLAKGMFDAITCTQLLCSNAYKSDEIKIAKRSFHRIRRFISNGDKLFRTSKFVLQSLKAISITLRLAERRYKRRDGHLVATSETRFGGQPIHLRGIGLRNFYTPKS